MDHPIKFIFVIVIVFTCTVNAYTTSDRGKFGIVLETGIGTYSLGDVNDYLSKAGRGRPSGSFITDIDKQGFDFGADLFYRLPKNFVIKVGYEIFNIQQHGRSYFDHMDPLFGDEVDSYYEFVVPFSSIQLSAEYVFPKKNLDLRL